METSSVHRILRLCENYHTQKRAKTLESTQSQAMFNLGLGGLATGAAHVQFRIHGLSLGHNQPQHQPGSTKSMEKLIETVKVMQQEISMSRTFDPPT